MRHRWAKMHSLHTMLLHRDAGLAEILPGSGACRELPGREVLRAGLAAVHLAQGVKGRKEAENKKGRSPAPGFGDADKEKKGLLSPLLLLFRRPENDAAACDRDQVELQGQAVAVL